MNKIIASLLLIFLVYLNASAQADISGTWLTNEGNTKVEIYRKAGEYYGKIVWLKTPVDAEGNPVKDVNNPDKTLRERPLMDLDILKHLNYSGKTWKGAFYAPKRGVTANVEISLKDQDRLNVEVSYRGFSREQLWTRATAD